MDAEVVATWNAQKLPESQSDRFEAPQAVEAMGEVQAVRVVPDGSGMPTHADVPTQST